jgi:hypothetical protein
MTRGRRIRTFACVVDTSDTGDGTIAGEAPRWSIAGLFLEYLTARDSDRLAGTLSEDVRFRALQQGGPAEWHGRADVVDVLLSWFGGADRFEIVDATVGAVGGRLQMTWRIRLRPAPFDIGEGWHLIEQHAFADIAETIEVLDLVCSGFRALPTDD